MAERYFKQCAICDSRFSIPAWRLSKAKCCSKRCAGTYKAQQAGPTHSRFWRLVKALGADECWYWTGGLTGKGAGTFRLDPIQPIPAHKAAYILAIGPLPYGQGVSQTCGNVLCCNPRHLQRGTIAQRKEAAENRAGMAKVYALVDPRSGRPRYVGHTKSKHLCTRLATHMLGVKTESSPKADWLAELIACGLKPRIRLLEVVGFEESLVAEQKWIDALRADGEALLNVYEADNSKPRPQSSREKIAAFRRGHTGWHHSDETRAKIGRRGESNSRAKITNAIVKEICSLHASGATQSSIAARYAVSKQTVNDVVHRRKWGHVHGNGE